MAGGVNQRAARIAGVDGGVGLDEILEGIDAELVAPECADNAARHRLPDTKGVADGQHLVTHLQRVGVAQHDHRQAVNLNFQHRQVAVRVSTYHLGASAPAVVQDDLDLVCALYHVVIRQDVTARTDDDAAAQTKLRLVALVTKEEVEPGVVTARPVPRCLAGVDADHRRRCILCCLPEAANRRDTGRCAGRLQQCHRAAARKALAQPIRFECGDDKVQRQQNGGGLRKK